MTLCSLLAEVSADMLKERPCRYVNTRHSEKTCRTIRQLMKLRAKGRKSLGAGLTPFYCVGENGRNSPMVGNLFAVFKQSKLTQFDSKLVLCSLQLLFWLYEPIWAIGTG